MKLVNYSEKQYGSEYKNHIIQQWVTCVEMSDSISEKRINVNNFFITLNSIIVAFTSFQFDYINFLLSFCGILICVLWIATIENYKRLNTVKYKVILQLEKRLPARPFDYEWELIGRGRDKKKYKLFARLEKAIPILFILIYFASILSSVMLHIIQ